MPSIAPATGAERATWLIAAACFAFSAWALHVGWTHSLSDVHAFRQSQTALSTVTIQRGGPVLAYETPIFGPPWTIPFELPVFQVIVAKLSSATAMPLIVTGRLVSVGFFAACLVLLWLALDALDVPRRHRVVIPALVAVSPLYIFWSRTFMIESTALALALAHLSLLNATLKGGRAIGWTVAAVVCGSLAGAVKATTFLPFACAAIVLALVRWRQRRPTARTLAAVACAVIIPVIASATWLQFTERAKRENDLSAHIEASSPYMRVHNFGTLEQRLLARHWYEIPASVVTGNTSYTSANSALLIGLALVAAAGSSRRWRQALLCIALFTLPIALFMNLYLEHVYYAYANGVFLIAALGLGVVACLEHPRRQWFGVALLALAALTMSVRYLNGYYPQQRDEGPGLQRVADAIRQVSRPDDVIVLYGLDWSSEVPFRADRRAIMDWENLGIDNEAIRTTLDRLPKGSVSVVAACDQSRALPAVLRTVEALLPGAIKATVDACDVYHAGR